MNALSATFCKMPDCIFGDAHPFRHFGHHADFAIDAHKAIAPRVAKLLRHGCPAHVAGLVASIVVDTVKGMLWRRLLANCREEGREVIDPFLAHDDASSAVVAISGIARVEAALFDRAPRPVLCAVRGTVSGLVLRVPIVPVTATRLNPPANKVRSSDKGLVAAFAETIPAVAAAWSFGAKFLSEKVIKRLPGKVFESAAHAHVVH